MKISYFFVLVFIASWGCSRTADNISYSEQTLLTAEISMSISDEFPTQSIFSVKKSNEWLGVIFMEEINDKKIGIYNLRSHTFNTYPPANNPFPPLFNLNDFCFYENKIVLIGGQIETITLNYNAEEVKKEKIDHGDPQYWSTQGYFDMWDDKMLTSLALPPVDDFPGMFSFIQNKKPKHFFGEIPDYLKERGVFRQYPAFVADRAEDKFYVKLQFDTLIYEYDLKTRKEKEIPIPAPKHFQRDVKVNKIESADDAAAMAARGNAQKNAHFRWIKVLPESIYYIYTHYDTNKHKKHTLYHYAPASNQVFYQDITDILIGKTYFQEDSIFSVSEPQKIIEYYLLKEI